MEQYVVLSKIGEGAFGKALLARERAGSHRRCVLKQVNLCRMSTRDKEAAKKEVTILSKMKHPNIVTFFQSFYDRNSLYIVMEYCDGGDLTQKILLQRGKPFTEEQITDWFVQMCLGLKHIHDRKILHRDIKTQNIFLSQRDKRVKLGDFGIARILNNTTELARTWVGTPNYISPEICENKPYNNKTDIWSLGCVLYELCALRHPFEASSWRQLIVKICRGRYNPISNRYSSELRVLLSQLFKVSPQDRPSVTSLLKRPLLHKHTNKPLDPQVMEKEFTPAVQPVAQHVNKDISVIPRPFPAVLPRGSERRRSVEKPCVTSNKKLQEQAAGLQVRRRAEEHETKASMQNYSHYHQEHLQHQAHLHHPPVSPRCLCPPPPPPPPPLHHPPLHHPPLHHPPLHHPHCFVEQEPTEMETPEHTPNPLELVAAAREEYLQRRQEANQYKHRAEKQLGLRPSTGEAERYRVASPQQAAHDRGRGEQEYLRQLQQIRQRYWYEIREGRQRANAKLQDRAANAYMNPPAEKHTHPLHDEQKPTNMKTILRPNQKERRDLQTKAKVKKAVMFEIKLHGDGEQDEREQETEEKNETILQPNQRERSERQTKAKDKKAVKFEIKLHGDGKQDEGKQETEKQNQLILKHQEDPVVKSPTNHKLSGSAEEADIRPAESRKQSEDGEKKTRRGQWRREAPQTLLNALENMKVSSVWSTCSSTLDGDSDDDDDDDEEEEENPAPPERRKWSYRTPVTLLNALAEARLTCSTQGSVDDTLEEYREDDFSDVEVDEERLEPRSDEDDTNFEESEDEMMEHANDSMTNFFIMKEGGDEEEVQSVKETSEGDGSQPALG